MTPARGILPLVLALQAAATAAPAAGGNGYSVVPDAFVYCTTCHGVELRGNISVDAPRLNGMEGWYVRRQLQAFKRGDRGTHPEDPVGKAMQPQAAILSDQALDEAVAFVTRVPLRTDTIEHTVTGNVARGERLYSSCAACHGGDGRGIRALGAPGLAGQSDWYLVRQLQNYLSGTRGYADADTAGRQMRAAAAVLSQPADVRDVVAYINTLPANGRQATAATSKEIPMNKLAATSLLAAAVAAAGPANADVKRYPLPGSDFPISQAVEVTADTTIVYHSGMVPRPANPEAPRFSREFWGDTEAQTLSVFQRLAESLAAKGLDFGHVVKMQVYLVGVPELDGAMDFQGMMRAYRKYFGTEEQPNLPARSAFQVAGLAAPGMLVEIEVVLARP